MSIFLFFLFLRSISGSDKVRISVGKLKIVYDAKPALWTDVSELPLCFYLVFPSQVNYRVIYQMKNIQKSKVTSGSGICEWGDEIADFETA